MGDCSRAHEDWARRHLLIMEDECPPVTDTSAAAGPRHLTCMESGVCLCTGRGLVVKRIRTAMINALKRAFPMGIGRVPLYEGFAAFRLWSIRAGDDEEDEGWTGTPTSSLTHLVFLKNEEIRVCDLFPKAHD